MPDIIRLLPDSVANQIAAGEVIQRPASAVKELLENSIDAGADEIHLLVKDAGRTLIQISDNGKGMSETDARLSFERHATSKISQANDLFSIRTMGFRGEAMASIAAVAQVELKTRPEDSELGTRIVIEGSDVKSQEPCQCPKGTTISIKNLFFNIPARRNFLKSNQVELRHIVDEFTRVAMAFPGVALTLVHNEQEIYRLDPGGLRQRITALLGAGYNERLVPVSESTQILKVEGFIGKPEYARKTRGEQFFFVNNRFIKSPYLHHAVSEAFEDLLPADSFPGYFLFLEVDPKVIDINIHPTKTEVKFEDERSLYAILRSTVKQSLGRYHISPSLDFERETSFDITIDKGQEVKQPSIKVNPGYNPFQKEIPVINRDRDWQKLYPNSNRDEGFVNRREEIFQNKGESVTNPSTDTITGPGYISVPNGYFISSIRSGIVIIDQRRAHQRVLFEKFVEAMEKERPMSQQQLFPQTIELTTEDVRMLEELFPVLRTAGFELDLFGSDSVVVNGIPAGSEEAPLKEVLEKILENYRREKSNPAFNVVSMLATSLAQKLAVPRNKRLKQEEMNNLADELFACSSPYITPSGKPTLITLPAEELDKRFQR